MRTDNELFWHVVIVVAVTIPAALMTGAGVNISKDPTDFVRNYGFLLPCIVVVVPTALAFAYEAGLRALDPGEPRGAGRVVSLITSIIACLVILFVFVR